MPHPKRRSECPISFALDLLGDRWTLLLIRDFILLEKRRFSELLASDEGIATNVLTDRLQRLSEAGVIDSSRDPEDGRKVIYRLTEMGISLVPAVLELARWGATYDTESSAPKKLIDRLKNDHKALGEEIANKLREA